MSTPTPKDEGGEKKSKRWAYDFICSNCGHEVASTDKISIAKKLCISCETKTTPSPTPNPDGWVMDYYNFLVNNGMTKRAATQGVDFVKYRLAQQRKAILEFIEKNREPGEDCEKCDGCVERGPCWRVYHNQALEYIAAYLTKGTP